MPGQTDPTQKITWEEIRLQGSDSPILRASRKLVHEEQLITVYSPSRLCLEVLDRYLWRECDRIDLKRLWEYFAQYLYLPRLKNAEVLLQAIKDGIGSTIWTEHFAYAEGWDEIKRRYLGLNAGENINPIISSQTLLVKATAAIKQIEAERIPSPTTPITLTPNATVAPSHTTTDNSEVAEISPLKRFYGAVALDVLRINRDAAQIANEVIQHLTRLERVQIQVTLEIEDSIPDGAPDDVVRTVMENCRTLKFNRQAFEYE